MLLSIVLFSVFLILSFLNFLSLHLDVKIIRGKSFPTPDTNTFQFLFMDHQDSGVIPTTITGTVKKIGYYNLRWLCQLHALILASLSIGNVCFLLHISNCYHYIIASFQMIIII